MEPSWTIGQELSADEGRRSKPFKDSLDRWCCGVGCDMAAHGMLNKDGTVMPVFDGTWTDKFIDQQLQDDILVASVLVHHHLDWSVNLDGVRQRVLLNMMFQLGWDNPKTAKHEGLSGFTNMLGALRKGNWMAAREGILTSLYYRQVPVRAGRMAAQLNTGIYYPPGSVYPGLPPKPAKKTGATR